MVFHRSGTLAYCNLDGVQTFATRDALGDAICTGYFTFDPDGFAECDWAIFCSINARFCEFRRRCGTMRE